MSGPLWSPRSGSCVFQAVGSPSKDGSETFGLFGPDGVPPTRGPGSLTRTPLLFSSIMPNRQKQVLFCSAGLLSLCCALSAAVITGLPFWLRGAVLCRTGAELVNATGAELDQFLGELSYGLFHGERVKQCGLGGRPSRFSFFPDLLSGIPAGLHVIIILFCSVEVLFSSVASGFFFFNTFGRPYETLQGPMGLYLWTCICWVGGPPRPPFRPPLAPFWGVPTP
ncbi:hypothetical protein CRENBAI_008505 [Crenichthys baileyi]|uniref:Clarin 1 n=1 Tax=Crenichthys baileyi TaxID=28760 RepID=A0AAV9QX08_9TELE